MKKIDLCKFYALGKCKYGDRCRLSKLAKKRVQNKALAPVQITAEQLLREAKETQLEVLQGIPKRKITDKE